MKGTVGAIIVAFVLIVAFVCVMVCVERVPTGYVGVVYNMNGGVDGEKLSQGWHIVSPSKRVTMYTIGLEQSGLTKDNTQDSKSDESFNIPTSDGKTVNVSLEFSYRFDEERITDTFVTFKGKSGDEIKDTFIKPKIKAWSQEVSANYPVADIFGDKRTAINEELDVHLEQKFYEYGIIIDTVNFTDISVDDETAAAIQKKVNAQQAQELARIQAETDKLNAEKDREVARIAAEKDKEVAQIAAEKQIIAAEADAKAVQIAAEAEADANQKIAASLTPELIEKIKYEQWNGILPATYVGDGDVIPVLQTNSSIGE